MIRNNCVICNSDELNFFFTLKNIPVYMGATESSINQYLFHDLKYSICEKCNNLQVSELIPLEILYQNNHNIDVVGETWENHNIEFANFIRDSKPSTVVEIGSASSKIYNKLKNEKWLSKWFSIEPNPSNEDYLDEKFTLIKEFIDKDFIFEKKGIINPNAVVMSHVFEHLYNPSEILSILYNNLQVGESVFISIPNMKYISDNYLMPPSGLHFEHTYFVELKNLNFLMKKNGFKIDKVKNFLNHSFFIKATKVSSKRKPSITQSLKKLNHINLLNFNNSIIKYKNIVESINNSIDTFQGEVYIYGAHFPAQILISLGLNVEKINGCLDQSKSKIGKKLYGTNLKIFDNKILINKKNICVICHMGPYTNEIKNTISNINKNIIFL